MSCEDFGPLTEQNVEELSKNPYKDDCVFELEKDQKRYSGMLKDMPEGDPARSRIEREHTLIARCLELRHRQRDWGNSDTVDLKQTFTKE